MLNIGILCLQGAFIEHIHKFRLLGTRTTEIRKKEDFTDSFDGIVVPGGESTVIGKLLRELDLETVLRKKIEEGMPVYGTCAGLILLAKTVENEDRPALATMDITVRRNAYGRQLGSFFTTGTFGTFKDIPMTFIRAPYITEAGRNVKILSVLDGKITAARQNNQLVTAFHPELNDDLRIHRYFLDMILDQK